MAVSDHIQRFFTGDQAHERAQPAGEMSARLDVDDEYTNDHVVDTRQLNFVQTILAAVEHWVPMFDQEYMQDPDFVRALLSGVGVTWEPTFGSVMNLRGNKLVRDLLPQVWAVETVLSDDAGFSNARFALLTLGWGSRYDVEEPVMRAAAEQVRRLSAVGRVDFGYMRHLPQLFAEFNLAADLLLYFGHDMYYRDVLLEAYEVEDPFDSIEEEEVATQLLVMRALQEAPGVREQLFRLRWLARSISMTEHAEVRDMDVEMLRGLYPQVWAAGYEGYRAAVAPGKVGVV